MTTQAYVRDLLGFRWAAVYRDESPIALYLDLPHVRSMLGDVWLGRVTRVDHALDAAFVDLGDWGVGFLRGQDASPPGRRRPIAKAVHEGQLLQVEVVRDGDLHQGKGPRLTTQIRGDDDQGFAPSDGPTILRRRSDALSRLCDDWPAGALDGILVDGAAVGAAVCDAMRQKRSDVVHFATAKERSEIRDKIDVAIDQAASSDFRTRAGVCVRFERTRALTVIDVDTAGSGLSPLEANLEAARAIARLLRLKQIGGVCVIDFITIETKEERKTLADAVREWTRLDPRIGDVGAVSARGLLELTRAKTGLSIAELVNQDCPVCDTAQNRRAPAMTALRSLASVEAEASANRAGRPVLSARPQVIEAINNWLEPAVHELADRIGRAPEIVLDPAAPEDGAFISWKQSDER